MDRILVIEDNVDLRFGLQNNLEVEGYEVAVAADGIEGIEQAVETRPQLIILDLMLPKVHGLEVLKRLRKNNIQAPILILTAKGEELDKVQGLRLGADDYVTKPFGLMELLARVEALLRRHHQDPNEAVGYEFGDVLVQPSAKLVLRNETVVELAPKEYELLMALLRRNGAAASRLELLAEVWQHTSAVVSRTVDTHIAELRRKLEANPKKPRHILTVRKTGYRLDR